MTDNAPASHMYGVGGFGHGGVAPNYNGIGDQARPCNDFSQYDAQYPQYGQGNIRPGYSLGPVMQKEAVIPNRQGMGWGSMNNFQSGCPPGQQQRYLPAGDMPGSQPSLLPGSAPTLNQLLHSPNNDQRYSGMYGEYGGSHPKTSGSDDAGQHGYCVPQPGWSGQQRMVMGAYQQQIACSPVAQQTSPNQGVGMYDVNRRSSVGMGSRYPPPQPPSHHGPSVQSASPYLTNTQPNSSAVNQLCGQVQSFSPNHALLPAPHLQPSPSTTPLSQQSDHSSSNIKAPSSPQSTPTTKHKSKKHQKRQQQSKPQLNAQENCVTDDTFTDSSAPAHHSTSHHAIGSHHQNAVPSSPAGSVSSRSNTPASLSGNMVGSPLTNQHEGQNRILSPVHSQAGGSGQAGAGSNNIHNSQQQMMPPPPVSHPSHHGISPGSSKSQVLPHLPPGMMNPVGSSPQMSPMAYGSMHYNSAHYGNSRGPPGSHAMNIPGYSGGHPDFMNGPSNHVQAYGPGGMMNRGAGYPGSYGNNPDSGIPGQFGGGYSMNPAGMVPGMPANNTNTSSGDAGYHTTSAAERTGINGKLPSSADDVSFTNRPSSSSAETHLPNSQPAQVSVASAVGRTHHSARPDGGPGRNPFGMPPPYDMSAFGQQQQYHHSMMGFGKPFPHHMSPHPGSGAFARDQPSMPGDERSSRNPDGGDPGSNRLNSMIGISGVDGSSFLKRPYDITSVHEDHTLSHHPHHPIHQAPSYLPSDGVALPSSSNHMQPCGLDDSSALPSHPPTRTNMGPPASSPYMAGSQPAPLYESGKALESHPSFSAASPGFGRDKWSKPEFLQQSDSTGRNSISDRDRPRGFDEGSTSDTQSSAVSQLTDDSSRFPPNLGNEPQSVGNGAVQNKTTPGTSEDTKKTKASKSKKQKSDKLSSHVVSSPMTPIHDELDDISNASRPTTPKSEVNDVLNKLIDMGDEHDRRPFLERLFAFMEDSGTPIVSIPMISKTAIDLYKLYHLVREHGGMVEVTKNKKWRDVSAALNIGPSSSAGFTLKKNYGKHLFGFECRFDRGNVDPIPLLAMLEQPTKKESKKAVAERAAAAAANAQEMYRMSSGQQFGCYPGGNVHLQPAMDPGHNPMLMSSCSVIPGAPQQMPYGGGPGLMHSSGGMMGPSMSMRNGGMLHPGMEGTLPPPHALGNAASMGQSMMPSNNGGETISIQDPFSDMPGQVPGPLHRPGMNYMGPGGGGGGSGGIGGAMPHSTAYGSSANAVDGRSQRMPFGTATANKTPLLSSVIGNNNAYDSSQSDSVDSHGGLGPDGQDFPAYSNRLVPESGPTNQPSGLEALSRFEQQHSMMSGGQSGSIHSLRHDEHGHPDSGFYVNRQAAVQQRPLIDQQSPFSHGYPGGGYPSNHRILPPASAGDRLYQSGLPGMAMDPSGQQMYMGGPPGCSVMPLRHEMMTSSPHRSSSMKPFGPDHRDGYNPIFDGRKDPHWMTSCGSAPNYSINYTPNAVMHGIPQAPVYNHSTQMCMSPSKLNLQPERKVLALPSRSDFHFPPDSVEAFQPSSLKRKRYTHRQLGSVDAWRLMMSLKSGMIAESTCALEILTILLHDEATHLWFGLQHLPGLIEVLLEHFRRCLIQIFPNDFDDLELGFDTLERIANPETGSTEVEKDEKAVTAQDCSEEVKTSSCDQPDTCASHDKLETSEANKTFLRTRGGETVVVDDNSPDQELVWDSKKWDVYEEIDSSLFDWQMGRGDTSVHVLTRFNRDCSTDFCSEKFFGRKRISNMFNTETKNEEVMTIWSGADESDASKAASSAICKDESSGDVAGQCIVPKEELMSEKTEGEPAVVLDSTADMTNCTQKTCSEPDVGEAENLDEIRALERMKRKWTEDEDAEIYHHDHQSLFLLTESQIEVSRRCLCISNIFRSLSFVPGNDSEISRHPGLLLVLGKLLMLSHIHPKAGQDNKKIKTPAWGKEQNERPADCESRSRSSEALEVLREDTFVIFANISGQLDLSLFPEEIVSPILNGLLHWVTCSAACAHDPLPTMPSLSSLSPRRLILETLCKLCVTDSNVDLLMATPPYSRIILFLCNLVQLVAESGDQVVREFAVVLISSLVQADTSAARAVALHHPSISILLDFIELADHRAVQVVSTQGIAMLKDSPEMMGTSLDMLRRAAAILCHMAEVPENKTIFAAYHQRLLHLVMSQIMDQKVSATLAEVLYHSSLS